MKTILFTFIVLISFLSVALAQEEQNESVLNTIIVTATKRPVLEKDTPLSIKAITGKQIEEGTITNIEDLSISIPNLTVGDAIVTSTVSIRGMGSGADRSFEQSVGLFVDGIYKPRSRQYRSPFFDVERVEVVRGPQAVMFGLNTTAGAVSIISSKTFPGDESFVSFSTEYEFEYDGYKIDTVASASLTDKIAGRVAVRHRDSGDGSVENSFSGEDTNRFKDDLLRATLVVEPSKNINTTFIFDYASFDLIGSMGELYGPGSADLDGGDGELNRVQNVDISLLSFVFEKPAGFYQEAKNFSVDTDFKFGDYMLTALVGYSDMSFDYGLDLDTTPLLAADVAILEDYDQYSAELRFTSPDERVLSYILGLYYQSSELSNSQPSVFGPVLVGEDEALIVPNFMVQDTSISSLFGSSTYHFNDTFKMTVGARYVSEDKSVTREGTFADGSGSCTLVQLDGTPISLSSSPRCTSFTGTRAKRKSDNFMPEIIFQKDINQQAMLYAKAGKSAKAGGFVFAGQLRDFDAFEYDDEIALGYEVGYKNSFWNGRGSMNLIAFHTKFKDLQLNSFQVENGIVSAVVRNAGTSISKGFELEFNLAVSSSLTIGTSAATLDARFDSFVEAPCNRTNATSSGVCDYSGKRAPFAPQFSGTAFAKYKKAIAKNLDVLANISVSHKSSYFTEGTLDPNAIQDKTTRIDARIGIAESKGNWMVSLIGKNLTNEVILNFTQPFLGYNGYIAASRTIHLQAKFVF